MSSNNINQAKSPLSSELFLGIKGYLALMVLLHHIYQYSGILNGTYVGYIFILLGRWAVTVFIFMTGYGLLSSYKAKGDDYIKSFPKRRILSFYLTYLLFLVLYIAKSILTHSSISAKALITSLTIGGTIIDFGWYLQVALVLYIAFWFAFRFYKNKYTRAISLIALLSCYVIFSFLSGAIYYIPVLMLSFAFGMLVSIYENKILPYISSHRTVLFIVSLLAFGLSAIVFMSKELPGISLTDWVVEYVVGAIMEIAELFTVLTLIFLLSGKAQGVLVNKVTCLLGKYSLEIYAMQGIALGLIFQLSWNIYIRAILAIALTIALAFAIKPLTAFISKRLK